MKSTIKQISLIVFCLTTFFACNKDYYIDSGIHNAKYDGTIWQYLETRPELFDSLRIILEISDLDDVVKGNDLVTLFAPTNQSIQSTLTALNRELKLIGRDTVSKLDQIDATVWSKYMLRYIFTGKNLLANYPQIDTINMQAFPGQGYISYGGEDMNIGVLHNDVVTTVDGKQQVIQYAGYRQLYLNYPFSIGGTEETYLLPFRTAAIATSDIQPNNGALHVLRFETHAFGFVTSLFVQDAIAKGINN